MDKARETAVNVLNEVHSSGAYANVALVQAFRRQSLNDMDRRFVTELVYGTVKAGATLDWIMKQYIKIPFRKIAPLVQQSRNHQRFECAAHHRRIQKQPDGWQMGLL